MATAQGSRWEAYLHIFKTVLLTDDSKNIFLTALLHLSSKDELVKYEVCFLEIKYNVQFADIAVVFVHLLNVSVHDFEGDQFVIDRSAAGDEEEGSIASIDHFCLCCMVEMSAIKTQLRCKMGKAEATFIFKKIAHSCASGENKLRDIFDDFGLLLGREGDEPFC